MAEIKEPEKGSNVGLASDASSTSDKKTSDKSLQERRNEAEARDVRRFETAEPRQVHPQEASYQPGEGVGSGITDYGQGRPFGASNAQRDAPAIEAAQRQVDETFGRLEQAVQDIQYHSSTKPTADQATALHNLQNAVSDLKRLHGGGTLLKGPRPGSSGPYGPNNPPIPR